MGDIAGRFVWLISGTFFVLSPGIFAAFSVMAARTAVADVTLDVTTPQGCGAGVAVSPMLQLIVRAAGIASGGVVAVQISETNAFNQKFADTTTLSHDVPERTLTTLNGFPFPPGNLLITAKIAGQTTVVSCQLTVAGEGTPTSTPQPTNAPPTTNSTATLTPTVSVSPSPSATSSQTTAATDTPTASMPSPSPSASMTASPTPTTSTTSVPTPTPSATGTPTRTPRPASATPTVTPTPSPSVATAPDGDANCDGRVSAADPTGGLVLLSSGQRAPCRRDDANHDGALTAADVSLTASLIFDQ